MGAEFALIPICELKVTKSGNGQGTVTSPGRDQLRRRLRRELRIGQGSHAHLGLAAGSEFKG
ncbi:MAG: hypothetical protein U0R71_08100 [Solirubrobacterales bacterium]